MCAKGTPISHVVVRFWAEGDPVTLRQRRGVHVAGSACAPRERVAEQAGRAKVTKKKIRLWMWARGHGDHCVVFFTMTIISKVSEMRAGEWNGTE
jgi:hypothetical protein